MCVESPKSKQKELLSNDRKSRKGIDWTSSDTGEKNASVHQNKTFTECTFNSQLQFSADVSLFILTTLNHEHLLSFPPKHTP